MNRILQYVKQTGIMGLSVVLVLVATLPLEVNASQLEDLASNTLDSSNHIKVYKDSDQSLLVTIDVKNMKLSDVLNNLTRQANVGISYDSEIDIEGFVTMQANNKPFFTLLDSLLKDSNLEYTVSEDQRVLVVKQVQEEYLTDGIQEEVTGRIVDSQTGEPLPGVNIVIRGTSTGTSTDGDGNFELEVPDLEQILIITYIGYQRMEVPIDGRTELEIELVPGVISGDELVVIGYGIQRKSDLTGSVGSIDSRELMKRPAINVEQSLSGKLAGVYVATNSGRPGGRTRISIRGFSSINASNDPLYVVDGITAPDGISHLNPNDIASINVLKDASSTAIYGTRGSNGVILITTKRGEERSAIKINYDSHIKSSWLPKDRKLDVLNSEEFLHIEEEQYKNAPKFDPVGFENGKYQDPVAKRRKFLIGNELGNRELFTLDQNGIPQPIYDVDWQDMSTRTAISHNQNLSFTGGDELTSYGLYLSNINDNGILKQSFAKRYTVRTVVDRQMKGWLKIGGSISYSSMEEGGVDDSGGSYDVIRRMVEFVPFVPYKYDDGTYGTAGDYEGLERQDNPVAEIYEIKRSYNSNSFNGNTYARFNIFEGLEFTSTLGLNVSNNINPFFESSKLRGNRNDARINSSESEFWQWSNRLNYYGQIAENHNINILAGAEIQTYDYLNWSAGTEDMPDDYYEWHNLGAGASPRSPSSYSSDYKLESYFSRFNYNYNDKYLLTTTGRIDGSSKFGLANKYAFFPSVAIAWNITEEGFLMYSNIISDLKLRVSYGLTGNSDISPYSSLARLSTNDYIFNGSRVSGSAIGRLANPELQWEKTTEYNIGVDFGLFRNSILIEADYFFKNTHDLLLNAPVPASSGYTSVTRNIGSMENEGIELSVNSFNVQGSNFNWTTNFNFSFVKNQVTALGENNEDIIYGFKDALILRVGEPVGSIWGYRRDGIWSTNEIDEAAEYGLQPGDVKIRDLNGDGIINEQDNTIIGNGIPDFYGTLTNTFRYKNFDLLVELQYSKGNDVFDNARNSGEARQGIANSFATVLDAWTSDNQDAILEQVRPTGAYYAYYMDERNLTDGSFIRGKNLMLGYSLPNSMTSSLGLNNLRIYASLQNFFLLTDYYGYDPEVSNYDQHAFSQGMTYADYPKPRSLLMGVNLSF